METTINTHTDDVTATLPADIDIASDLIRLAATAVRDETVSTATGLVLVDIATAMLDAIRTHDQTTT